ncbi:hypothetical protein DRP04_09915 [Archaeoglobales archaeon]|nr:MAG: hypothetical protein DRP04_09915 [Archaeoglobales archaeon]
MGKTIKLPKYSEEEIKKIEEEFDTEEGWVKADEILGKDRVVKSTFVSDYDQVAEKLGERSISEQVKILCNPIYAGIGPYPSIISDEKWIEVGAKLIEEIGIKEYLLNVFYCIEKYLGDFPEKEKWITSAEDKIKEIGVEKFLRNLLATLREAFYDFKNH